MKKKVLIGLAIAASVVLGLCCILGIGIQMGQDGGVPTRTPTKTPMTTPTPTLVATSSLTPTPMATSTLQPTISPTKPPVPAIPEGFKTQARVLLTEGSTLVALTSQGVSPKDFAYQLALTEAAYELAILEWPDELLGPRAGHFDRAMTGWRMVHYIWELKIGDKDNPIEPNVNGYQVITEYGGDQLIYSTHSNTYIVESYRGRVFLPFDDNISALMSIANKHFTYGREWLTELLH